MIRATKTTAAMKGYLYRVYDVCASMGMHFVQYFGRMLTQINSYSVYTQGLYFECKKSISHL